MAGLLTYVSVFLLMAVWVVGWSGVAMVVGALFDLPLSTTALLGALLGPIGSVVVVLLGSIERYQQSTTTTVSTLFERPNLEIDDVLR